MHCCVSINKRLSVMDKSFDMICLLKIKLEKVQYGNSFKSTVYLRRLSHCFQLADDHMCSSF